MRVLNDPIENISYQQESYCSEEDKIETELDEYLFIVEEI